jgi:cytochrome c5
VAPRFFRRPCSEFGALPYKALQTACVHHGASGVMRGTSTKPEEALVASQTRSTLPPVRLVGNEQEHQMKRVLFVAGVVAALLAAGQVAAADGKMVYEQSCKGCHTALKPKMGDKEAWAPLIKQGPDALTASVIKGKGMMPPRGKAASDADVKAAVEYMLSQSK